MANKQVETKEKIIVKTNSRPPVVTIMGHVDHGKTTLLDFIRHSHVADKEYGGITQHIGAYQVAVNGQKMTFIDTPGHEAFAQMRARGASVTDIVILVVAADDGIMPQTKESIAHIKTAGVPFVVAVNKMDTPGANLERVKKGLAEEEVLVEGYGGNVPIVGISAKTGDGVKELLEIVGLLAELEELTADPKAHFKGVVIESALDKFKGPVATILVKDGTLKLGDPLVVGAAIGKVKALFNDQAKAVKEALPGDPVEVLGFTSVPAVGAVVGESAPAVEKESEEKESERDLFASEVKELKLIVKADRIGSLEALNYAINQIPSGDYKVRFILKETGDINESDILLAATSKAIIIGFNVKVAPSAQKLADEEKVNIRKFNIIYELLDELKDGLDVLTKPKVVEEELGQALIKAVFTSSKGNVAGCEVVSGSLRRGDLVKLMRNSEEVFSSRIKSIRYQKEDIPKADKGEECGILLDSSEEFAIGDILYAFKKL
jgi:translation initiation factor IF-2